MEWILISIAIGILVLLSFYIWTVIITFGVLFRRPITDKVGYPKALYGRDFNEHLEQFQTFREMYKDKAYENLQIISNNTKLHGKFFEKTDSNKVIVFVHGYYANGLKDIPYHGTLYEDLGVSYLVVDQRASGDSDGKYITFGVKERYDLREWLFYLDKRFDGAKDIYIVGVSMGAATALLLTGLNGLPNSLKGVIADSGYSRINGVFLNTSRQIFKVRLRLLYFGVNLMCRLFAGFSLNQTKVSKELKKNVNIPILFIHGTADIFVPFNMSVKNYKATQSKKSFVAVEGAVHCESYIKDPIRFTNEVRKFIDENGTI